jgi:tRNA(adenine34) deaminase
MQKYEKYMRIAIKKAHLGEKRGEPPFGGIMIDKNGRIIAESHDTVVKNNDMTCHSEFNLVKIASKKIGPNLSGCTVICTCEPCPLCFTALWLSKVSTIVFGSYISDVLKLTGEKQRELNISAEFMNKKSGSQIKLIKEVMRKECIELFANYKK